MKILFLVAHLQSGGAERTVSYLSSYFAKKDWEVTVLSLSDDVFYQLDPDVHLVTLGIPTTAHSFLSRYTNIIKRYHSVGRFLKKSPQDVVVCLLPEMAKYVFPLLKKKQFSLITSERINPAAISDPKVLALKKKVYRNSDGIVFQTQRAKEFYDADIQAKGIVIHNAVGNELVYQVPDAIERKKKITAIGRIDAQKDYPTLLKAFARVTAKHPAYRLEIFGSGSDAVRSELEQLAETLGVRKQVVFRGAHSDAILQAADSACYVMSSLFEGMPNALMEAMAAGIPCISTDCPNGPAELIESEKNGLLVPVGDADALADAICRMIEQPDFAAVCGKAAKQILNTHSVAVKAQEYADYIVSVKEHKA